MFAAVYGLFGGFLMMGWWLFSFAKGQVPEVTTEPIRLSFHVAAAFLTATLLVVSGFGLLFGGEGWALPVYLVAVGMLLYSVIVSPGTSPKGESGPWSACLWHCSCLPFLVSLHSLRIRGAFGLSLCAFLYPHRCVTALGAIGRHPLEPRQVFFTLAENLERLSVPSLSAGSALLVLKWPPTYPRDNRYGQG